MSERVIAAAIRDSSGTIWTLPAPARHCHVIQMMHEADTPKIERVGRNQGFLTSTGRWVDRAEARELALRAGQITKTILARRLLSEDVW